MENNSFIKDLLIKGIEAVVREQLELGHPSQLLLLVRSRTTRTIPRAIPPTL